MTLRSRNQRRRAVRCGQILPIAFGLGCHLLLQREELVHKVLHNFRVLLLLC